MTTFPEMPNNGLMPTLEPITSNVYQGTSPEWQAAIAAVDAEDAMQDAMQENADGQLAADGVQDRFVIDNEDKANWLLRKIANLDAERRRIQTQAADMIAALDREEASLRARFESDLAAWTEQELARRGGKTRTLRLLQGTVAFRTVPASIRITGTGEALEYAKAQGWDVVRVMESLDSAAYKQQAEAARQESGELLPGVEVVPERQSFSIKFPAAKEQTA